MPTVDAGSDRSCFSQSTRAFVELVAIIDPDKWEAPALGIWTVRDLVGHTSRALSTIESYLGKASGPQLNGPVEYFLAAKAASVSPEEIAKRGVKAGEALGSSPYSMVQELAHRVTQKVEVSQDTALVGTPWGTMTLAGYLPTRTFELTVHSIDLAAAIDVSVPPLLSSSIARACELAGALAGRNSRALEILLALTGRSQLAKDITVL